MRIGFATADWALTAADPETGHPQPGGAGWYRCAVPAAALSRRGHDVTIGGAVAPTPDERLGVVTWGGQVVGDLDVVVVQRWMHPDAGLRIRNARDHGQVVVQDIDDWFWGLDPANQAFAATHPRTRHLAAGHNRKSIRHAAKEQGVAWDDARGADGNPHNRDHYLSAVAASTAITVSTPYLAERLKRLNVPTFVLRNAIDLPRWPTAPLPQHRRPVIGWVGAVPWRSGDLEILRGVLGPFVARHDLRVVHCGAMHPDDTGPRFAELAGIDPERVVEHPMVPILDYPAFFDLFDVGLVPLRDMPFNYAKSAIKGMELAAAGRPFIASSSPEYDWFCDGWTRTVRRPRDWISQLERLLDRDQRVDLGETARLRVTSEAVDDRISEWEDVYSILTEPARVGPSA